MAISGPGLVLQPEGQPDVEINVGPKRFGVTARPVRPGEPDYAGLWQIVNKNFSDHYETHQRRTSRPIPLLVLTPR